jgi:hypothetical protein
MLCIKQKTIGLLFIHSSPRFESIKDMDYEIDSKEFYTNKNEIQHNSNEEAYDLKVFADSSATLVANEVFCPFLLPILHNINNITFFVLSIRL